MICVVVPLLLNFRVFLEFSGVLAVVSPPLFLLVVVLYRCDVQLLPLCCVLPQNTGWKSEMN
jgi:hypothetical protein